MSLDDRSLREHLDRRATGGLTDPADLAESVVAALPAASPVSWWRPSARSTLALGLAAAAVVAVVLAGSALLPLVDHGPGSSALPTSTGAVSDYPAERPLTVEELATFIDTESPSREGAVVVADVLLEDGLLLDCAVPLESCPKFAIDVPDRFRVPIFVIDPASTATSGRGVFAFRVRSDDQGLEMISPVRPGPRGLTWTLAGYLAELPSLLASDRLAPQAYVIQASAVRMGGSAFCPVFSPRPPPATFDVGCGRAAWLAPEGTVTPDAEAGISAPDDSLRIQNDSELPWVEDESSLTGYFLVRPLGVDGCFLCVTGHTSQYLATLTPIELPIPSPTDGPVPTATPRATAPGDGPTLTDLNFSTNAVTLEGFETADINVTATLEGGVIPYGQMDGSTTPLVCLQKIGASDPLDPHSSVLARAMLQIEGTNQWVASFRLTAGDSGQWEATCLIALDEDGRELNLDPASVGISPVLTITGTHAPYHTMEFDPTPAVIGQPLEVFGRVSDEDTGEPLEGVTVTIGIDNVCAEGGAGETVTTDASGEYTYDISIADGFAVCTWITDLPGIFPGVNAHDPIAIYGMLFAHPTDL